MTSGISSSDRIFRVVERLAVGDIDKSSTLLAKGFDTECAFLAVAIAGDEMYFNAISSAGRVVDSGLIQHRPASRRRLVSGAGSPDAP